MVNLANATGAVTKTYDYSAFGIEQNPDTADTNPFRYCGEYYDTETGKYYLRARYYDPINGRFTQPDTHWNTANMIYGDNPQKINEREDVLGTTLYSYKPQITAIVQSGNLYVYGLNNPLKHSDVDGQLALESIVLFLAAHPEVVVGAAVGAVVVWQGCCYVLSETVELLSDTVNYLGKQTEEYIKALIAANAAKAAAATPDPNDDGNLKRNWQKANERYLEKQLNKQGTNPHDEKKNISETRLRSKNLIFMLIKEPASWQL